MARFTIEEMQQIFRELEAAGMDPQLCDTPVPYYDAAVQAVYLPIRAMYRYPVGNVSLRTCLEPA